MKFGLTKKIGLAIGITMLSGIGVHAAQWNSFSATMPAYMGAVHSNVYAKQDTSQYMSFKGAKIPMSINMVLMNSGNATRSDRLTYPAGRSSTMRASERGYGALKGYRYHIRVNTSTSQTSSRNVAGYWSPDYMK
ncbi:hypothetical protein VT91_30430 [Clostridium sporogenes]|uniref:hypothetical protein n=1 Tax=Clostridium botulinum TaxID=1491 RepID=UPI0007175B78|nr:hypothetical protein [Clostridium botulinum]KRU24307.1 hypothetical protein WG71_35650 [Clostridium sporogenes]KRU26102.1 hypothetical protein VT91_30430 [Clostridium sporogenes]KRU27158.1 hypothetical protein VT28_26690 [Clostridium sporogenes]KRU49018.1 hypothetical protein VT95_03990 [Clostridium sporogenes]MBZ1328691.1 hypothetical protein [Clostridium botulinum]